MSTLKQKAEEILQEKEEKIIPENLPSNVTVLGVTGNLIPLSEMGVSSMTMSGTNIVNYANSIEFQANIDYGNTIIVPNNTGISIGFANNVVANSIGLTPEKLKKDEEVLGIIGTYDVIYEFGWEEEVDFEDDPDRVDICIYKNNDANTYIDYITRAGDYIFRNIPDDSIAYLLKDYGGVYNEIVCLGVNNGDNYITITVEYNNDIICRTIIPPHSCNSMGIQVGNLNISNYNITVS